MTKYQLVQQSTVHLHRQELHNSTWQRDQVIAEVNKIYSQRERENISGVDYLIRDIADWRHDWQCDTVSRDSRDTPWQCDTVWCELRCEGPLIGERESDQWRLHSGLTYVISLNTSCQYDHSAGLTSIRNHSIYRPPLRHWLQSTLIIIFTCFYRNKIGHELTLGLRELWAHWAHSIMNA